MQELDEKKIEVINLKAELASLSNSTNQSSEIMEQKFNFENEIKQLKASLIISKRKVEEANLEIFHLKEMHETHFQKHKIEGSAII